MNLTSAVLLLGFSARANTAFTSLYSAHAGAVPLIPVLVVVERDTERGTAAGIQLPLSGIAPEIVARSPSKFWMVRPECAVFSCISFS